MPEIETDGMTADAAARYRVMVAETLRMAREVAAMGEKLREVEADKAGLAEDAATLAEVRKQARREGMREAARIARQGREVRKADGTTEIEDVGDDAIAAAIRARGPGSALADALRQAEARGMREAAEVCVERGAPTLAAAILAAADAKEKPDAE